MGGFAPIAGQLCDDYALASLVKQHGGTIRQGITPQYLQTTVAGPSQYVRLMHRWFLFANPFTFVAFFKACPTGPAWTLSPRNG